MIVAEGLAGAKLKDAGLQEWRGGSMLGWMGEVVLIPADRFAAVTRAVWRALVAGLFLGAAFLLRRGVGWGLMWRTDKASALAMGAVLGLLVVPGGMLALSALRWVALAAWPRWVGFELSGGRAVVRLGPFGGRELDGARLRVEDEHGDLPAKFAEEFLPSLRHPEYGGDLIGAVMHFCRLPAGEVRGVLRRAGLMGEMEEEDEE